MASGVGTKYHVGFAQINTSSVMQTPVGYLVKGRGYSKQDAKTFLNRFGGGQESLSNLDVWKNYQHLDFSGGALQQRYKDTNRLAVITNGVYNYTDEMLYPTQTPSADTMAVGNVASDFGHVVFQGNSYVIANKAANGAVAKYTGTAQAFVKSDFAAPVTGLAVANNLLWAHGTTNGLWSSTDGTTWTQRLTSAQYQGTKMAVFKNKLVISGVSTSTGTLFLVDTAAATTSYVSLGYVGDPNRPVLSMVVFNQRLYIGKADGLYAYDGVQISTILDYTDQYETLNFAYMATVSGSLYFVVRNTLYRFNGSTIERLKGFDNYGTIQCLNSAYGRLWFGVQKPDDFKGSSTLYTYDWYYYDGMGFYNYWSNPNISVLIAATAQYNPMGAYYDASGYMVFCHAGTTGGGGFAPKMYRVLMQREFWSQTCNDLTVETSEFDGGLPYIDKYTDSITLTYEGGASGDTLTVYFRIHDGTSWGAWSSTVGGTWKRIQVRIVIHRNLSTSTLALKSFSFRYYLNPDMKREWQLALICQGQSDQPLELLDGTTETITAKQLREQIYACRINDVPCIFEDIDTCVLSGSHTNVVTTITVDDTSAFPPSGYLKLEDELILYTGKTATTFTGCTRGRFGTTAASHSSGVVVGSAYRVIITKILNEAVLSPANISGTMDTYGNASELLINVQEA